MFSVLMAIYKSDNPKFLQESLDSILNQSRKPNEVLIVVDGPLTQELENLLKTYTDTSIRYVRLSKNTGLALALREGIKECKYDLVARMDSDDVCHYDRFRQQFDAFTEDPSADVVGTSVIEFDTSIEDSKYIRELPAGGPELLSWAMRRSPVNHASVMYRKQSVLAAGNYCDFLWNEDYHLWARMLKKGFKFKNLKPALLYVRGGDAMFRRRGGSAMLCKI